MDDKMNNKKTYIAPEIIFEMNLETKAGSPLGQPDPGLSLPGLEEE